MNKKLKTNLKKFIIYQLFFILFFTVYCPPCFADETGTAKTTTENLSIETNYSEPTTLSKCSLLMDVESGQILYEHNAYEKTFPASTTKLMTAILTLENCKLDDEVTVSKEALLGIPSGYTIADLQAGEKLSVDELLHVLLIPSANDAANALACHIAGSVDNFAVKMNEKALELGCKNTNFVNPNGVHNNNHYSTAYDLALIGKCAYTYDKIKEIATQTSCSLPNLPDGKTRIFKSTNNLINTKNQYYYENATGLKTGYTDKAKSCIVATASKDDKNLLCVVLGGEKTESQKSQRELDCKSLFEFGFNNFNTVNLCTENEIIDKSKISNIPSSIKDSNLSYSKSLKVLVPLNNEVVPVVTFNPDMQLPILKGTNLGTAVYHVGNEDYSVNIIASEDILVPNSFDIKNIFYTLLGVFVIFIIFTSLKKNKKKEPKYFKRSLY